MQLWNAYRKSELCPPNSQVDKKKKINSENFKNLSDLFSEVSNVYLVQANVFGSVSFRQLVT